MEYERVTVERTHLHDLVWAEPVSALAARYGVSGRGFAKICAQLEVPVPGRGYWAKRAAGQDVQRTPLPAPTSSTPREHEFYVPVGATTVDPPPANAPPEPRAPVPPEEQIVVAPTLGAPHQLVKAALHRLREAGQHATGLVSLARVEVLDVCVSLAALDRALRLMDAVIKGLERRGHTVRIRPLHERDPEFHSTSARERTGTTVCIGSEAVEFGIYEKEKVVPRERRSKSETGVRLAHTAGFGTRRKPTGELVLAIRTRGDREPRRFVDTPAKRLEDTLNEFVAELERVAEEQRIQRAAYREVARQRAEEAQCQQREQERRAVEARWFKDLEDRAVDWERARRIHTLIDAVEARIPQAPSDAEVRRWISWARRRAEELARGAVDDLVNLKPR